MKSLYQRIHFLTTSIFDRDVAAITMSSQYVVRKILRKLPLSLDTIIEYGPGDGVMTQALLPRLTPQGKFFVIESNSRFVKKLKKINDPRLHIIHGRAEESIHLLKKYTKNADLIIASIPFSFLKQEERKSVVRDSYQLLAPNGSFVIFSQHTFLMYFFVRAIFKKASLWYELRNIPPCFIIWAEKGECKRIFL